MNTTYSKYQDPLPVPCVVKVDTGSSMRALLARGNIFLAILGMANSLPAKDKAAKEEEAGHSINGRIVNGEEAHFGKTCNSKSSLIIKKEEKRKAI